MQPHAWRNDQKSITGFQTCKYYEDDLQFSKLQAYAKAGKIISLIGDINNLTFLGEAGEAVSVVDISNIHDYTMLNFKFGCYCNPRIIMTTFDFITTNYFSFVHDPLNAEESKEFDTLFNLIKSCTFFPKNKTLFTSTDDENWIRNHLTRPSYEEILNDSKNLGFIQPIKKDPFNIEMGAIRRKMTLVRMKRYVANNILSIPNHPNYNMDILCSNIEKINNAFPQKIDELTNHLETRRFVKQLAGAYDSLEPKVYIAFSKVDGWMEAFEQEFSFFNRDLNGLLKSLEKEGLLDGFIQEFGSERIQILQKKRELSYKS
jgi:hypothetical protein